MGLKGWVRNLQDGSVEVQAEGPPIALAELRAWCEKGPLGAQVKRVKPCQMPVRGDDWFEVRY
jgi:acylphosphatase